MCDVCLYLCMTYVYGVYGYVWYMLCVYDVCVSDLYMCMFLCVSTGTCLCAHVEVWRQPCGSVLTFLPVWDRVSALCHYIH